MPKHKKAGAQQAKQLLSVYERVTCLEKLAVDLSDKELETLATETYHVVQAPLDTKRRVLLNELLDLEVELRVRNRK